MSIEDAVIKTGVRAGIGTVAGGAAAAYGAASAPHAVGVGHITNQAAKAGFAGVSSWRHAHKLLPALGVGAATFGAPAIAAAVAAAPVVLGVAVGAAAGAAVGGAIYGISKLFKD